MAKITTKVFMKFSQDVYNVGARMLDKTVEQRIQREVIDQQIKPIIASGSSPVKGASRFPAYKDKDSYPGKRKPSRPVNLKLTGDMLSYYRSWTEDKPTSMFIGFQRSVMPELEVTKVIAHNEGTATVPKRKFVPGSQGDEFRPQVMIALRRIYRERMQSLVDKMKKRR